MIQGLLTSPVGGLYYARGPMIPAAQMHATAEAAVTVGWNQIGIRRKTLVKLVLVAVRREHASASSIDTNWSH